MLSVSTFVGILPTHCVASVWKITPRSWQRAPISGTSLMVPISLFAHMIETRIVSSRMASATMARVITPSADDPLDAGDELIFVTAPDQEPAPRARGGEAGGAGVLHERERALEQCVVGQSYDHGVRYRFLAVVGHLHSDLRQFGQADAEVDVGARVVRAPPLLFAPVAAEHDPAEVEAAIVGRARREFRRRVAVEARPDAVLRGRRNGANGQSGHESQRHDPSLASHRVPTRSRIRGPGWHPIPLASL